MQIGPHTLSNNLILAPMAGATDKPFRMLCKSYGAGLAVTEMVSSNSAVWGTQKSLSRVDFTNETGPISVQIMGADPYTMAEAAKINVGLGADIIDINMGCPAKKVCKVAAGSALMKDEKLVQEILSAIVKAVDVPVTLKTRTGWDVSHKNGLDIARIAEAEGIQALTIHGRTRACKFSGHAEYDTIRQIKQAISIPVIANGDIDSPEKVKQVLDYTQADAVMIGRAACGRPWLFSETAHFLTTGELLPSPNLEEIIKVMSQHLEAMYEFYGDYKGTRFARKHIAWYSRFLSGGSAFRKKINNSETPKEQLDLIVQFFDQKTNKGEMTA